MGMRRRLGGGGRNSATAFSLFEYSTPNALHPELRLLRRMQSLATYLVSGHGDYDVDVAADCTSSLSVSSQAFRSICSHMLDADLFSVYRTSQCPLSMNSCISLKLVNQVGEMRCSEMKS